MTAPVELVIAIGDPQGVGPEVSVRAARTVAARRPEAGLVLVGDPGVLGRAGADASWARADERVARGVRVLPVPLPEALQEPPPSAAGGRAALAALDAALGRVVQGGARALVTAPISKEAARKTDPSFDGHTGWLAKRLGVETPVMMFVAPGFRVVLATVHVPLARVPSLMTPERLRRVVQVTRADFPRRFGIPDPRIDVLGLNPHAGENGGIGAEERDVIGPAIRELAREGVRITGPHPADSYFRPGFEKRSDVIVAMYHDQGLLPVKCLAFGDAVNVTLGLPIVRTSVDHGTGFDRAWGGEVDARSMEVALELAIELRAREIG